MTALAGSTSRDPRSAPRLAAALGFYPKDKRTTYFSIQFQGVNNKASGDYPMASSRGTGISRTAARRETSRTPRDSGEGVAARFLADTAVSAAGIRLRERAASISVRGRRRVPKSVWRQNGSCGPEPVDCPAGRSARRTG